MRKPRLGEVKLLARSHRTGGLEQPALFIQIAFPNRLQVEMTTFKYNLLHLPPPLSTIPCFHILLSHEHPLAIGLVFLGKNYAL